MQKLVRAVIGDQEVTVSAAYAAAHDLEVVDQPTHRADGRAVPATRRGGRPVKPKTSVAKQAAAKKAAAKSADSAESTPSKENSE